MSSNSLKITRFYGEKEKKDKQAELKQAELNAQKDYRASLSDLRGNSKPLINTLSIVAGENRKFGKAITETIESHLLKAVAAHKLPCLYLVDSIIKNVGAPYIEHISKCVVRMFTNTFSEGDETVRKSLFKLRLTWKDIFTVNKLRDLDASVHEIDPNWPKIHETESASSTVHINPNFLKKPAPAAPVETEEMLRIKKEKAALELAQRKFEEEKKQFERLQLQLQLQKQKERMLNENKANESDSGVLGEIVKGKPTTQSSKSPLKSKDKRKLDKAPKHQEMQPPAVKTKRTARKSIAAPPATQAQKLAKMGRIPKLSAEDRAKAQEQNEKKRPRQSDSEGSETDKQKPKRVYPLRSRSISGDPRDNKTKDDSGSDMSVESEGEGQPSKSHRAHHPGPRPAEPKPPIPVATVNPAPMNIPIRPPPPSQYIMTNQAPHENSHLPASPEKQYVRPPPPSIIPPRPPAPISAPPRPTPPPQVQDIPVRPPAPAVRPPAPANPVRPDKEAGKGKITIIAPLKLPGDPEEITPAAKRPPPGPAPAAMRPSFEDRQTSDPRYNERRSRSPDSRYAERRSSPVPDPRDRQLFRTSPQRHYRDSPALRDEPRRDEPRRDEPRRDEPRRDEPRRDEPRRDEPRRDESRMRDEPRRDNFHSGPRGDFHGSRDDRRPDFPGPRDMRGGPGPMRDDMRRDEDWRRDDGRDLRQPPRDGPDRRRDIPPRDDMDRRRDGGRGGRRGSPHMRRSPPPNPDRKYYGVRVGDVAAVPQADLPEIVMFDADGPKDRPPQENFTIDRRPDKTDRGRGHPRGRGGHGPGPAGPRDMEHDRGGFRGRGGRGGGRGRDHFPNRPDHLPHRYLVKPDYTPSQYTRLFHVAAGDFEKGFIDEEEFQALKDDILYFFPAFRFPGRYRGGSFRGGRGGGPRDRGFEGPREPGPPGVSGPAPAPILPGPAAPRPRLPAPAPRLQVPTKIKPLEPVKQLDPASLFDKLLKTGLVVQNAPFKLSFDYIMNLNKDALIDSMYTGTPCTNCGKRFDEEEVQHFNVHLDWHFRINTMSKAGQISKKWFLTTEDWTSATSNSGSIALHADNAAPADTWQGANSMDDDFCGLKRCPLKVGDDDFCYVCHDRLQQEFNQKEDEWYFINAQRRDEDGKVCHVHCMQEGLDEANVTQGLEVTMNESIVDSVDSGSRSRIASQISQDLVTPTAVKPPELVIDKEKEAAMLALLEKAKTALVGNKTKAPDSSSPSPEDDAAEVKTEPPAEQPLPDTKSTEETSITENEANPPGPPTEPPTETPTEKKPEEDPDCLDDSIFEECSPAPVELDIQKEVEEAILALK